MRARSGFLKISPAFGGLAVGQIDFDGGRVFANLLGAGNDVGANLAEGISIFRQLNGRLEHLGEAHRAPAVQQDVPGVDDPGDAAGEQAVAVRD